MLERTCFGVPLDKTIRRVDEVIGTGSSIGVGWNEAGLIAGRGQDDMGHYRRIRLVGHYRRIRLVGHYRRIRVDGADEFRLVAFIGDVIGGGRIIELRRTCKQRCRAAPIGGRAYRLIRARGRGVSRSDRIGIVERRRVERGGCGVAVM
jgi:hypothetical protein